MGAATATVEAPRQRQFTDAQIELNRGRRRFTIASLLATGITAVPFLWILFSPWETPDFLRSTTYEANFYDLQARAVMHGHLYLPNGSIGVEGFIHGGHTYTYFGLFPSILRMPILAVTSALDGKLTAPSILLAWLLTAMFGALLLWRVRLLVRGAVPMGTAEATTFGLVLATITGGSVLLYLAGTPFVFHEDLAWSVALTIGAAFALLGVMEEPSWTRVGLSGVLILLANLNRITTGWACAAAAILIAIWFRLGRGDEDGRRWFLPMLAVAVVPLGIELGVNWAKFGTPVGLPSADQVYTQVNAYRRRFLAANNNSEVGFRFPPSNVAAYLQPGGLRFTPVFPFVTLPDAPPKALFGVLFDRRYRTASMPSSMPLPFLLSCWGAVTTFRRSAPGRAALARIPLIALAGAGLALLFWGYISERYLADFVPFLALGSALGLADLWRRNARGRYGWRGLLIGGVTVGAVFSVIANIGIAITPTEAWSQTQLVNYVRAQHAISDVTGHPLNGNVTKGATLPYWGPADQLYIVGNCSGLYISNGEDYSTVPAQQYVHATWMTVQRGPGFQHSLDMTIPYPPGGVTERLDLVSVGSSRLSLAYQRYKNGYVRLWFELEDRRFGGRGIGIGVNSATPHRLVVVADTATSQMQVSLDGVLRFKRAFSGAGPVEFLAGHEGSTGGSSPVVVDTTVNQIPALCRTLAHGS